MLEFHRIPTIKFIVLEGTGRIFTPNRVGESVLVHAGQMLITKPNAKNLTSPVDVDIRKLMKDFRVSSEVLERWEAKTSSHKPEAEPG